jgi:UbiD family decarboxylase
MAFYDLREFIERLKKTDDIILIEEEMDWNLEIGAVIRRCNEKKGPATLFQKIKDYTSGYRIWVVPLLLSGEWLLLWGFRLMLHFLK